MYYQLLQLEYLFTGIKHINNSLSHGGTASQKVLDVSNSVCQCGVMSPVLFNMYMGDLSVKLNTYHGCRVNGVHLNHLNADDMVLIAQYPDSLQLLINAYGLHAKYNAINMKTVCMSIVSV